MSGTAKPASSDPNKPGWLDVFIWRNAKGEHLTMQGARKEFPGLHTSSIGRWADMEGPPCRFLTDASGNRRHICSEPVVPPVPRNHEKIRVFLRADLAAIDAVRSSPPTAERVIDGRGHSRLVAADVHVDGLGRRWLTDMQAHMLQGVPREFCPRVWAKRPSRLRSGNALRSKRVPNPSVQKGGPGEITVFLERDLLTILGGQESRRPGTGQGLIASGMRAAMLEAAKKAVKEFLADGAWGPAGEVFAHAKATCGASAYYVRRAFKSLRGISVRQGKKGGPGLCYLWKLPQNPSQPASSGARENMEPTRLAPTLKKAPAKNRGGRPVSAETAEVQKFCYEHYVAGNKLATIRVLAQKKFGARAPKQDGHVTTYAQRYATANSLPLNRPK